MMWWSIKLCLGCHLEVSGIAVWGRFTADTPLRPFPTRRPLCIGHCGAMSICAIHLSAIGRTGFWRDCSPFSWCLGANVFATFFFPCRRTFAFFEGGGVKQQGKRGLQRKEYARTMRLRKSEREASGSAGCLYRDQCAVENSGRIAFWIFLL